MGMPADAVDLLASQHGVASRRQLVELIGQGRFDGLLRRGRFVIVHRGVVRVAGATATPQATAMAALLRSPAGARITGPLPLALLGASPLHTGHGFHVLLPEGRVRGEVPFVTRRDPIPTDPAAHIDRLPAAPVGRCLVDAGHPDFGLTPTQLLAAFDRLRWQGSLTTDRFHRYLDLAARNDRGAAVWRRLRGERSGLVPESGPERDLYRMTRRFDPAPEPQVWVTPSRRADLFWRVVRVVIAYLGRAFHDHAAARRREVQRDGEFGAAGLVRVGVTAEDLARPDETTAWLHDVAVRRAAELGVEAPRLR